MDKQIYLDYIYCIEMRSTYDKSKNKYSSQEEVENVARKYRELHIPIDNIVQDWFWWTRTGEFKFNPKYPDPKAMIDYLHKENIHLMISVWPFFDPHRARRGLLARAGVAKCDSRSVLG